MKQTVTTEFESIRLGSELNDITELIEFLQRNKSYGATVLNIYEDFDYKGDVNFNIDCYSEREETDEEYLNRMNLEREEAKKAKEYQKQKDRAEYERLKKIFES